jgi:hypothetical protein
MAYVTGTANTMADVLAAIQNACVANGWTLRGNALCKGSCYTSLTVVGSDIQVLGGTGIDVNNALTAPGPQRARIGSTKLPIALTFPLIYHIHVLGNPDEVYVFLNYSVTMWQWLAFGGSPAQGVPGTGGWYAAQSTEGISATGVVLNASQAAGYNGGMCGSAGLFAQSGNWSAGYGCTSYLHHGLDGLGWSTPDSFGMNSVGAVDAWLAQQPLLGRQPNTWNNEIALIPILVVARRPSNKVSLVAQITHARYVRINNLQDGEIITLGQDRWKTYPFLQKNASAASGSSGQQHSGTFGHAVRYDGP